MFVQMLATHPHGYPLTDMRFDHICRSMNLSRSARVHPFLFVVRQIQHLLSAGNADGKPASPGGDARYNRIKQPRTAAERQVRVTSESPKPAPDRAFPPIADHWPHVASPRSGSPIGSTFSTRVCRRGLLEARCATTSRRRVVSRLASDSKRKHNDSLRRRTHGIRKGR